MIKFKYILSASVLLACVTATVNIVEYVAV